MLPIRALIRRLWRAFGAAGPRAPPDEADESTDSGDETAPADPTDGQHDEPPAQPSNGTNNRGPEDGSKPTPDPEPTPDDGADGAGEADDDEITVEWNWPPNPCIQTPHLGEGDETIEIQLYYRAGDDGGEDACRAAIPWVRHAFEEAWGTRYTVDIGVHPEPVSAAVETFEDFNSYVWSLDSGDRARDANCLLFDEGGVAGRGGEDAAVINVVEEFRGAGFDPDEDCVREHGATSFDEAVNLVIHEIGHSLGLSHDGGPVRMHGRRYIPPMRMSYDDGGRYYHQLHDTNRKEEPGLSSRNDG
jgi:hypothetical protein